VDLGLPCVHCGLCLNTCPTYRVLGTEADSPRGRIYIMEAVSDGSLALDSQTIAHLDGCLGCLACETACPSGVSFGRRIEAFRPRLEPKSSGKNARVSRRRRRRTRRVSESPALLRAGMLVAAVLDAVGLGRLRRRFPGLGLLPGRFVVGRRTMRSPRQRCNTEPPTSARLRAGLLAGCVADLLRPEIGEASVDVLHRHGVDVDDRGGGDCCGALDLHAGRHDEALAKARRTIDAFEAAGVDVVVTTAAGCGAMIKGYGRLLSADPTYAERAVRLVDRCKDVVELLAELGLERPASHTQASTSVAYHDACHLLHAQGVGAEARAVVAAATGHVPVDLGENAICCGSAGSYNLDHPDMAEALGTRKAELAREIGVRTVAVANIGCILQLERALARAGLAIRVRHPVEMLAEAYRQDGRPLTGAIEADVQVL
jgi:glycolate oxidase iron-sulfur subunit